MQAVETEGYQGQRWEGSRVPHHEDETDFGEVEEDGGFEYDDYEDSFEEEELEEELEEEHGAQLAAQAREAEAVWSNKHAAEARRQAVLEQEEATRRRAEEAAAARKANQPSPMPTWSKLAPCARSEPELWWVQCLRCSGSGSCKTGAGSCCSGEIHIGNIKRARQPCGGSSRHLRCVLQQNVTKFGSRW